MKKLSLQDLDDLALGSAILGSGGGGDPAYELLFAKQQFEDYQSASLVSLNDIDDEALVVPIAFMGAPLVSKERIPSGRELPSLLKLVEKTMGRPVTHLLAAEIGGANAFTPLIASAETGLPVIDADTIGRAFPELQMSSCNLFQISPSPCFMADCQKNGVVVYGETGKDMERFCRKIAVEMGSSAAIAIYLMNGKECQKAVIPGTMSLAIEMGRAMRLAKATQNDPIEALLELTKGIKIGSGVISDIDQVIKEGFLTGSFTVTGENDLMRVYYQNEYLMLYKGGKAVVSTPDIIIPLEQETGLPITSESLVYGMRVVMVAIPGPPVWKTPEGMMLVGPTYFGYTKEEAILCQKNI